MVEEMSFVYNIYQMRKPIKMKNRPILLAMAIMMLVFTLAAIADDAADLKKLQPLTEDEQEMYNQVKNNVSKLHGFIVTRTDLRAIEKIIGENWQDKDYEAYLPKFPKLNKDFDASYAVDMAEQLLIIRVKSYQGARR